MIARRRRLPVVIEELRAAQADHGVVTGADERAVAQAAGLPMATVDGTATYYSDLRGRLGDRHVRVCAGTACFVASGGGRHLTEVQTGCWGTGRECSPDGAVSLQEVHCLGYCYAGPAALDGDLPHAVADLAEQLAGRATPRSRRAGVGGGQVGGAAGQVDRGLAGSQGSRSSAARPGTYSSSPTYRCSWSHRRLDDLELETAVTCATGRMVNGPQDVRPYSSHTSAFERHGMQWELMHLDSLDILSLVEVSGAWS